MITEQNYRMTRFIHVVKTHILVAAKKAMYIMWFIAVFGLLHSWSGFDSEEYFGSNLRIALVIYYALVFNILVGYTQNIKNVHLQIAAYAVLFAGLLVAIADIVRV